MINGQAWGGPVAKRINLKATPASKIHGTKAGVFCASANITRSGHRNPDPGPGLNRVFEG